MNVAKILAELRQEQKQVDEAILSMEPFGVCARWRLS
jgi:hypothetical protein